MVGKPPILLPLPDLGGPKRGHPALANCCRPSCWPEQQAMDATGLKALGRWARALYHLPPLEIWELFQLQSGALTGPPSGYQAPRNRTGKSPWGRILTCATHQAGPQTSLAGDV